MKRVGLALGGGGARGVAHIAYIKAMEELGIKPCIISGTSSGAIVGALYASGVKPDEMYVLLQRMFGGKKNYSILAKKLVNLKKNAVSSMARKTIDDMLPKKSFEELNIPLKVVATNFHTLKERVFTSGSLLDAVMGSVALPGVIAPQLIDGQYYMDGGATNVVPFDILRNECDILIAIDVSRARPNNLKPNMKNSSFATWAATQEALISLKQVRNKVDLFVRPSFGDVNTMEFGKFNSVYKRAEELVPDFKSRLEKLIYKGNKK